MIALALSPIGRWLFGALAILAVLGGLYAKGRHDGRVSADSRWAAAAAAEQIRQSAVRAKALDAAALRELAARADANAAEQKADDYAAELARQPEPVANAKGVCPPRFKLGADDVRSLGVLQH